jgi:hypothetical protein
MVELHEEVLERVSEQYAECQRIVGLRHQPSSGTRNRKAIAGIFSNVPPPSKPRDAEGLTRGTSTTIALLDPSYVKK